ncbi:hypothetical protein B0H10DRAFT_2270052 [Mycena sp. CBHHK59/15]|nr:hypothetical protein B0H10DRAFT_2270052 [Mycena sp. CBHHK59/15]
MMKELVVLKRKLEGAKEHHPGPLQTAARDLARISTLAFLGNLAERIADGDAAGAVTARVSGTGASASTVAIEGVDVLAGSRRWGGALRLKSGHERAQRGCTHRVLPLDRAEDVDGLVEGVLEKVSPNVVHGGEIDRGRWVFDKHGGSGGSSELGDWGSPEVSRLVVGGDDRLQLPLEVILVICELWVIRSVPMVRVPIIPAFLVPNPARGLCALACELSKVYSHQAAHRTEPSFRTSKAPTPPRRLAFNNCKQHSHLLGQLSILLLCPPQPRNVWVGRSLVSTRPYRFNARGLTARSRPLRATRACLADPLPPRCHTFSGVEAVAIGSFAVERITTHPNALYKFDSGTRTAGSGIPAHSTYTSGASPIPLPYVLAFECVATTARVGTAHAHHTKSTPESVQSLQRSLARLGNRNGTSPSRFKILGCHALVSYGVSTPQGHTLAGANVVAIVEAVAVKRFVGSSAKHSKFETEHEHAWDGEKEVAGTWWNEGVVKRCLVGVYAQHGAECSRRRIAYFHFWGHGSVERKSDPPLQLPGAPVLAPSTAAAHTAHVRLLSRFMDPPAAQFSLHRITLVYRAAGKDVGMQLGPSAAAVALQTLFQKEVYLADSAHDGTQRRATHARCGGGLLILTLGRIGGRCFFMQD